MGRPKTKNRFPGTRWVRDRSGAIKYCYVTPIDGGPEIRVHAQTDTPDWEREYLKARGGEAPVRPLSSRRGSGMNMTFSEAVERCLRSIPYKNLAPDTQYKRKLHLRRMAEQRPNAILGDLTKAYLADFLGDLRPLQHRAHIDSIRTLFRSLDLEDPTRGYIFPKPVESKGFRTWKEGDLEKFRDRWPLGSLERTIFELGYHTCQRKSDLIRMKWSDIITLIADDGQTYEAIYVHAQHKTQETVVIPVDPDLREALDAYKAEMQEWLDMMEYKKLNEPSYAGVLAQYKGNSRRQAADDLILLSHLGYPLTPANYHNVMRPAFIAAGLPVFKKGMETHQHTFSGHGLRKGGMNGIAEGGGNVLQIMAISGHKSPKHVMHYVQDMEKQRAAIQAVQLRRASLEKRQADRAKAAGASSNIVSLKGERK